ncbi:MAG: hypothetical protein NHB15_02055 [Methanosarcina barkeri]|nr:hypothetical protein [Methanosarcina sp. ERenArc_MAG2]
MVFIEKESLKIILIRNIFSGLQHRLESRDITWTIKNVHYLMEVNSEIKLVDTFEDDPFSTSNGRY